MESRSKKFKVSLVAIIILFSLSVVLLIPGMVFAADDATGTTTEATTPETINIPETLKFDVQFPEIKAKAGAAFTFNADLLYEGDEEQTFDIAATGPEGWYVSVAPSYQESEITAIKMVPAKKETLKITAAPLIKQEPGEYDITITVNNEDLPLKAETTFKAIITATYDFTLTSKSGMLNTKATSGENNPFIVVLTNTGSADIENLALKADAPEKWIVKFEPEKIETFKADAEAPKEIKVTITPPDKTIAGDYMLTFSADSANSSKSIDIRVTVTTPSIWAWVGIAIIVIVVIGVAIIFARLGRR